MTGAVAVVRRNLFKPLAIVAALAAGGLALETRAADPPTAYVNRNYQDVPLVAFPGVTVAQMKLPPGQYLMHVKLRYKGEPGVGEASAACVFQGVGIGGLDASSARVALIGGDEGQHDGVLMDILIKGPADDAEVHVQCWGPKEVHIINTQFAAVPYNLVFYP